MYIECYHFSADSINNSKKPVLVCSVKWKTNVALTFVIRASTDFLLLFLLHHLSPTSLSLSWTDCRTNKSKRECRTRRQSSLNLKEKDKRGNKHQQIWIKSMKSSCREPENITKFAKLFLPSHCWDVIIASFWPAHIPLPPANGLAFFNTTVFLAKTSTNPLGLDSFNVKSIRMMLKNKNKGWKKFGRMRYDIWYETRAKKSEAAEDKIGEKWENWTNQSERGLRGNWIIL